MILFNFIFPGDAHVQFYYTNGDKINTDSRMNLFEKREDDRDKIVHNYLYYLYFNFSVPLNFAYFPF